MGIPTTCIIRDGFTGLVSNAFGGIGLPTEVSTQFELPHTVFAHEESDLSPLTENIDKVIYALTKWEPKQKEKGVFAPEANLIVQGDTYQEALDSVQSLFLQNLWTDGLPINAPTPERVAWIMTGTELDPQYVLPGYGKVMAKGGIVTVEALAIYLAMAGGRPEYFPVMLAIAEAMTSYEPEEEDWNLSNQNSTTRSTFPAFVVSGTIGNQIRLNSGYGCIGPDPQHPAGGSIGRAIRFMMQILGGGVAGIGTMSNFGGMRYTNVVFAEDEEGIPPSWPTLGEDRGYSRGANIVTGEPIGNFVSENISETGGGDSVEASLDTLVPWLTCRLSSAERTDINRSNGFVVFPDTFANICDAAGYSKLDVKTYLYEKTSETTGENPLYDGGNNRTWDSPYALNPEQVMLVVAGGAQSQHCYIFPPSKQVSRVSKPIVLPSNWDDLLAQAEEDIGPNVGHTG
jgi:hypothetical protein